MHYHSTLTSVEGLQVQVATALVHVLEDDGIAVTNAVIAQGLFVIHQRQAVECNYDFVSRYATLDFAEGLEILQLQFLAHVQHEHAVVAERRHRHLHDCVVFTVSEQSS